MTLEEINKKLKKLKREFYDPINRRMNGKPLASVRGLGTEIQSLKVKRCELQNHPKYWDDGYCYCRNEKKI